MASILLIQPSFKGVYGDSKISVIHSYHPPLSLTAIAAVVKQQGHKVEIFDMAYREYDHEEIKRKILEIKPDIVGVSTSTIFMNQMRDISILVKDISKNIIMVSGGPHISALPEESILESKIDIAFCGEADFSFAEFCNNAPLDTIKGIYYRDGDEIKNTGKSNIINDLDELPIPAWELLDNEPYKKNSSVLFNQDYPVSLIEFSRGCVYKCDYCAGKQISGLGFRRKSPERCAEEVKKVHSLGYRDFFLADDMFTSDKKWAEAVCDEIIKTKVNISWTCTNGIRVESADLDLLKKMKKSGCYRVSFGLESGNDRVLKEFGKGGKATIKEGHRAVEVTNEAGLDSSGSFLLGLSPDDEDSMMDTINFAASLPLTFIKFGITIPFPGSEMFNYYYKKGLIKSFDWDGYSFYSANDLFTHPKLSSEKIREYLNKANTQTQSKNHKIIIEHLKRAFKSRNFFKYIYLMVKFVSLPSINTKKIKYYAKERWPKIDFSKRKLNVTSISRVKLRVINKNPSLQRINQKRKSSLK